MRIGILSDTHIPEAREALPGEVVEALRGVDLILHGGDIYNISVLDELQSLAPVLAALGDDDHPKLLQDPRVKESHVLYLDGLRLGLAHRIPYTEIMWQTLESRMEREFGGRVDIVVCGDTHQAQVKRHKDILLVNPGSATLPNYWPRLGTVALLEVEHGQARAKIVQLVEGPLAYRANL